MKAYIGNVDWADEGDIFFFSIASEETLQLAKELLKILKEIDVIPEELDMYWGTNEFFIFDIEDLISFIDQAEDISDDELKVFEKFKVTGFDIYDRIISFIGDCLDPWNDTVEIEKDDVNRIKPLFIKLFGQKCWNDCEHKLVIV